MVAVHPDDETLGGGGTLLKYIAAGHEVSCMYITEGNEAQQRLIPVLHERYGFKETVRLKLPEVTLDDMSLSEMIGPIARIIKRLQPEILFLPNRSDPHSDHRKTFDAFQACIKSFRYPSLRKVLMMEVISETDFAPALPENVFIPHVFSDISAYMEQKMEILQVFETELLDSPYTRSLDTMRAYNRYRGSQINAAYAECFMLIKEII